MKRRNFVKLLSASLIAAPLIPKVISEPVFNGVVKIRTDYGWKAISEINSINPPTGNPPIPCVTEAEMAAARIRAEIEHLLFKDIDYGKEL